MRQQSLPYFDGPTRCLGWVVYDELLTAKRPVVLLASAVRGQDEFIKEKAVVLATLGYVAFAVDFYGEGKQTQNPEEAATWMAPLFFDRKQLQKRMEAALLAIASHPKVDAQRMGAIGFCFGGLAVYELFRSASALKAVALFHPMIARTREGKTAPLTPFARRSAGHVLLLQGSDDPFVSEDEFKRVKEEMNQANIDWQIVTFGHTMHAFTNPRAADPKNGCVYQERSAHRAWKMMQLFFEEVFEDESLP